MLRGCAPWFVCKPRDLPVISVSRETFVPCPVPDVSKSTVTLARRACVSLCICVSVKLIRGYVISTRVSLASRSLSRRERSRFPRRDERVRKRAPFLVNRTRRLPLELPGGRGEGQHLGLFTIYRSRITCPTENFVRETLMRNVLE